MIGLAKEYDHVRWLGCSPVLSLFIGGLNHIKVGIIELSVIQEENDQALA